MLTHLALSGGGIKGIYTIGALKYLEENCQLEHIEYILGTSVGSIFASFLCFTNVKTIIENIENINKLSFENINMKLFFNEYGIISKQESIQNIEKTFLKLLGINPTFKDLYNTSKKTLIISSFNLNDHKLEYFNHETHPDMLVSKAISLSINIPFVFEKEIYNNKTYIDAGVIDNLSWSYFDDVIKENKLGISLKEFPNFSEDNYDTLFKYGISIMYAILRQTSFNIRKEYKVENENICVIDNFDISPIDFKQTKEIYKSMLQIGYLHMENYLKNSNVN